MQISKRQKIRRGLNISLTIFFDIFSCFLVSFLCTWSSFSPADLSSSEWLAISLFTAGYCLVLVASLAIFKMYRLLTSDFGFLDAIVLALIGTVVFFVAILVMYLIPGDILPHWEIPVCLLGYAIFLFLLESIRVGKRLLLLLVRMNRKSKDAFDATVVIGSGSAAKIVIDESRFNLQSRMKIVALVDDDPDKIGRTFSRVPVFGPIEDVNSVIEKYNAVQVVIAIQTLTKERLNEIVSYLKDSNVRVRRLPILSELDHLNEKKILDVDINEILGRPVVELDNHEIGKMLKDTTVLITGAGGSIGSELSRQAYGASPKTLILFDIYENGVYEIQQELVRRIKREGSSVNLVTIIGSTYNETRVEQVMREYHPDYIYHAAAYKHVPLMETSPVEAIRTNDIGTYNVAKLADKYKVKKMLLISTDKAVRPTNAMGASKRLAEMIIQHFAEVSRNTKYCAVRFGNVLGSNGSVIPLFQKQIEEGGPITVTDANIIRYFMTIPEAVSLVLQSSIYADGGEIFILDMGEPVKILTLAEKMVRQAGCIPYKDIDIVITGLRPGEKLYEETLLDAKKQTKTANSKIFIEEKENVGDVEGDIKKISTLFGLETTSNDVKEMLKTIVTTYTPDLA